MTPEPRWLGRVVVRALHHDQLLEHGGSFGVRDDVDLDGVLQRPRRRWAAETDSALTLLAADYGHGICAAAPFVAGNERVAFLAMYAFLALNGMRLVAPGDEVRTTMQRVAAGGMPVPTLAAWLEASIEER